MASTPELIDLARELADIAARTTDAETARQLLKLIEDLMTEIGLPPRREEDPDSPH